MAIRISSMPPVARLQAVPAAENKQTAAGAASEFGQLLTEALGKVEQAQQEAANAAQRLATGEIKDVAEVMIASEKATLALQLTVQVRNKVLEA
ncbi:MAG TPA: flagellar hook-basal body complex protein FliE, partial [Symbiobacteriaceae bacterium]|nr:flagellar hook-basal body complex protein FliE [Symbiobacteriaceae bacterium]